MTAHCTCGAQNCFGYKGAYETYTCLCECHDERYSEVDGRQLCQAHDKRWAEPGFSTCRFHREYDPATRGAR